MPTGPDRPVGTAARDEERPSYRGADRRGIVEEGVVPADRDHVAVLIGASVLGPAVAGLLVAVLPRSVAPLASCVAGVADLAFIVLLAASSALFMRWKLVGEARAGLLAPAAVVASLLVVATAASPGPTAQPYSLALRALGVAVLVGLALYATSSPDVQSDLRPGGMFLLVLVPILVAIPLALTPARLSLTWSLAGVRPVGIIEAAASGYAAIALLTKRRRRDRLIVVATSLLLLLDGAACGLQLSNRVPQGPTSLLSSLLLLAGALALLLTATLDLSGAIRVVVRYDARGRRRWEAAEGELELWHRTQEGKVHDLSSALSAMDGTLLSLITGRERLRAESVDHLLRSVREQIQWFRTFLIAGDGPPREYDLNPLLAQVSDLRRSQLTVRFRAEPGLRAFGRPDRMAFALNNLLANCSRYAPSSPVTVSARRVHRPGSDAIEVCVADEGPGLSPDELTHLGTRGWRAAAHLEVPGSGLGLYQCAELLAADGGSLRCRLADPGAPRGRQGLAVYLELPAASEPAHLGTIHARLASRLGSRSPSSAERLSGR